MKIAILALSIGLITSAEVAEAKTAESSLPRCQQLAHEYAKDPESLKEDRLKQLQFCLNLSLNKRVATEPPTMLKGTIIEPLVPSAGSSVPAQPGLQSGD